MHMAREHFSDLQDALLHTHAIFDIPSHFACILSSHTVGAQNEVRVGDEQDVEKKETVVPRLRRH